MDFDAVLFDLDDTLYPYPPCNAAGKEAAWREARNRGYDLDRDVFEELYQRGRNAVKREIAGTAAAHERFLYFKQALQSRTGTNQSTDALALGEAYWSTYLDEMQLFEGVSETLSALQGAGVDIGLVTNLTTRIQLQKIERLGLESVIDVLVTSEETGREKPSASMFTMALARLDRRPSETLMVGNSVVSDIEGGNGVGLTTVLFNGDEPDPSGQQQPDHRIDDFSEIRELIL